MTKNIQKNSNSNLMAEVNRGFNNNAISFINAIYDYEGWGLPNLTSQSEIIKIHGQLILKITDELMFHRNKPVCKQRLSSYKYYSDKGLFPRPLKIIIDGFPEEEFEYWK